VPATVFEAAHGASHTTRVGEDATSAAHPARKAGQISVTLSSAQPGNAVQGTEAYFAGSEGEAGGGDVEATGDGVDPDGGVAPGAGGERGVVAQPATISSAAPMAANRVTSERGEPGKMVWFILEALVALLIAVAIVAWTMGLTRRTPRKKPGDADRDKTR